MKKTDVPEKEIDIETIKILLDKDPERRNVRDIMQLSNEIKNIAFFKKYQEDGYGDVHVQCAKYMKYNFIKKGEAVFHIDSVGDKFYLTLKGRVGIYIRLPRPQRKPEEENQDDPKNDPNQLTCVKELEAGFAFGELALLNNKPRLATIMCHEDTHFMTLDKLSFILILKQKEEERLFKEMGFFAKLPFFEGWNHNLIKLIYLNSFRIKYSKNEKIFSEGDEPASIYIVTEGEFVLQKGFDKNEEEDEFGFKQTEVVNYLKKEGSNKKKQIPLAVLVQNEMFGEEDIMNKKKSRTYSAICSTAKGECIVVKKRDFELRILHEEGARLYLENRLKQKNKYMQEKLQKIKGSIADYQNYLYDDRAEQKQKQQISIAISKIESPKKRQKSQVSFMEFPSADNDDNSNSSPTDNNQPFNYNSSHDKSHSIIRKQEVQSPTNIRRGQSILVTGTSGQSNPSSINNTQIEEKNSMIRLGSSIYKTRTIIELDKAETQQNKEIQLRKSLSIIEPQTPWRDSIANSKNINETFKNIFNFSGADIEQKQTSNLLQVPNEQQGYRRKSKLSYSQTLLVPNSSHELGGGISPIQQRMVADECVSPIIIRRQLSQAQMQTPMSQQIPSIAATPMTNSIKRDFKGVQIPHIDTFSSSLKRLSSLQVASSNQSAISNTNQPPQEQMIQQEEQPIQIASFERQNSMLSSSPLLKHKYEQMIKQKELIKQQQLEQINKNSNNVIQNSLNYVQNVLSSPKSTSQNASEKSSPQKVAKNHIFPIDTQKIQNQNNNEVSSPTKFGGLIRLRKSQENIQVHFEEEEGNESVSEGDNSMLIMNVNSDQTKKPKSPVLSKKTSIITLNKLNSSNSNNNNEQIQETNKEIPQINLQLLKKEELEKEITKNIESLCQIDDDISSYKQSSEDNRSMFSHKNSMNSSLKTSANQNNFLIKNDFKSLEHSLYKQSSLQNQSSKQRDISQDSQPDLEETEERIPSQIKTKKLNLKIKEMADKTSENLQKKITTLENEFNKNASGNSLDSLQDKAEGCTIEQLSHDIMNRQQESQGSYLMSGSTNSKTIQGGSSDSNSNHHHQKALINRKIIYNSSFSPMKGRKNEPQPYKFEQYKDTYYFKPKNKTNQQPNGYSNSMIDGEETQTNQMKIKLEGDNLTSPLKSRLSTGNSYATSYSPASIQRNSKQITNYQKVIFQKQRVYNKSYDNFKNDLSLRMGLVSNQTVRANGSQNSLSPSLSPKNQVGDFKSTRVAQSQPFLLNLMSGPSNDNFKNAYDQQQLNQSHSPSKLTLLKQKIEARAAAHSTDKLISQQKHTIVFDNHIPMTEIQKQKRFSAIRVYNKSEQNIRNSQEFTSEDHNAQHFAGSMTHKSQQNYVSSKEISHQNTPNSKLVSQIQNHQQNIKQICFPTTANTTGSLSSTLKQAAFKAKMRQQMSSTQNIAKSSINNPYSNLTLIQQHQQLHKYFNKHSELLKKVPQTSQENLSSIKFQSTNQI